MYHRIAKRLRLFIALLILPWLICPLPLWAEEPPIELALPVILISELATGTSLSAAQEFVEVYNTTDETVDLAGLRLQYQSATGTTWTTKLTLSGQVAPRGHYLVATADYLSDLADEVMSGGLAASGGHIRLVVEVDEVESVLDLVGWGTATNAEGGNPAPASAADSSIKRLFDADGIPIDTNDNTADFVLSADPQPQSSPLELVEPDPAEELPPEDEELPVAGCPGIIISELLPNPSGTDTGQEFIELYNPAAEAITLAGCALQTTANSRTFEFAVDELLAPGEYRAYGNGQTGLTLANAAGGTVWLLSAADVELHSVDYQADLDDDQAWMWLSNNDWRATYLPTPDEANSLLELKPCPSGQVRSKETGQCRASAEVVTPSSCPAGKVRNPATNRCRQVETTSSSLAPCGPGQERNPATNRCRATVSPTTRLQSCGPGQERNPATNRCRKVPSVTLLAKANDLAGTTLATTPAVVPSRQLSSIWMAVIGSLAVAYGAYEFRFDLRNQVQKLRAR
ncbi:lamin tail domain-containing protein, partial [Candidatus Microgenomates bacterium]|nr:lamin tail domain-containing protein [Candidatus Microgenomates bacterium]